MSIGSLTRFRHSVLERKRECLYTHRAVLLYLRLCDVWSIGIHTPQIQNNSFNNGLGNWPERVVTFSVAWVIILAGTEHWDTFFRRNEVSVCTLQAFQHHRNPEPCLSLLSVVLKVFWTAKAQNIGGGIQIVTKQHLGAEEVAQE